MGHGDALVQQQSFSFNQRAFTIPPELFHGSACGLWMWTKTRISNQEGASNQRADVVYEEDRDEAEEVRRRRKSALNLEGEAWCALFSPPTCLTSHGKLTD